MGDEWDGARSRKALERLGAHLEYFELPGTPNWEPLLVADGPTRTGAADRFRALHEQRMRVDALDAVLDGPDWKAHVRPSDTDHLVPEIRRMSEMPGQPPEVRAMADVLERVKLGLVSPAEGARPLALARIDPGVLAKNDPPRVGVTS